MRRMLAASCSTVLLLAGGLAWGGANSDGGHDDIGPIYRLPGQTAVCAVHCDEGPCQFRIQFKNQNGDDLNGADFWDVPTEGSRSLANASNTYLVSCEVQRLESGTVRVPGNRRDEPSLTLLDANNHVVATMTNERGTCFCDCWSER